MGSGSPLLLSLRRAAAGHRARGPRCPARRSCTASVGRGSGQKRPGLRVRRPALGEGQCLSAGGPGLQPSGPLMSFTLLGKSITCLPALPPAISSSGISQRFQKQCILPRPPVISGGSSPGRELGQVWRWGTTLTSAPLVVHPFCVLSF